MTVVSFSRTSRVVMGLRCLVLLFFLSLQGLVHAQSQPAPAPQGDVAAGTSATPAEADTGAGTGADSVAGTEAPVVETEEGVDVNAEADQASTEADLDLEYSGPVVLRIAPVLENDWLFIDADVHLPISDELRFFAERGVTLYFTADLEIRRPRRWWFDSEVVKTQRTWRVVYNALTRQWRVGSGDLSLPEASLDDALLMVRKIRGWDVLPASELDADELYVGRLRVRLDTSLLARPFRVDALNSSAWSLSTPWKDFSFSISSDGLPR